MSITLPGTWSACSVDELGEVVTGTTPSTKREEFYGGNVPFVRPPELLDSPIGATAVTLTTEGATSGRTVPPGAVLVGCIGNLGKVGIAAETVAFNQQINAVVPCENGLGHWFFYIVQSAHFREQMTAASSATTVTILNKGNFSKLELPIPPLPEQHRIVEAIESHLTRLDDAVASLERVQKNLKRYRASVLKAAVEGRLVPTEAELARKEGREYEPASVLLDRILKERRRRWEEDELAMMKAKGKVPKNDKWKQKYKEPVAPDTSDLPDLPEGWVWASPGQFFNWSSGNFMPKKHQTGEGLPVYGGNGIAGYHGEALIDVPTLVIGRVGAHCGNVHLTQGPSWITDNAIYASYHPVTANLGYWRMIMSQKNLNANSRGVGQPYVNQKHLNDLVVPLPPEVEQARIIGEVERLLSIGESTAGAAATNLTSAQRLRQSILKWAFEGKLVDQDPTDEPASVLLERIKAERAALEAQKKASKKKTSRRRKK